jgi:hypothetical protein
MDAKTFNENVIKTESTIDAVNIPMPVFVSLMEAIIALGTNVDMVKKNVFYGKPVDSDKWKRNIITATNQLLDHATYFDSPDNNQDTPIANLNPRMFHAAIGMYTESVEMIEALLKSVINVSPLDTVNFMEEISDSLWYAAIASDETNIGIDQCMDTVIKKLKARYPDKFDSDAAVTRDLNAERRILETGFSST